MAKVKGLKPQKGETQVQLDRAQMASQDGKSKLWRSIEDVLIALLVPLLVLLHLYLAPYSKVEESFNLQATHDILTYGPNLYKDDLKLQPQYDHLIFPGSVPRTFVGPLVLAGVSWPFISLVEGAERQIFVRAVLGIFNAFCILSFRNGVARAFGRTAANWYILLQASQFHVVFYASRTLPNFFAFGLTTLALRNLLPSFIASKSDSQTTAYKQALTGLTILGVIFRSEIALLLATHTLWLLYRRCLSLKAIITSGILGLSIGLALTIPVDSFFWLHFPLWPELSGFIYNVLKGQTINWGTSPFHYYFTSALPRLLLNPLIYLVLLPLTLLSPNPAYNMLIPNIAYIAIYSIQTHKEWRFIVYTIPPITAVAATAAAWIWTRRHRYPVYGFLSHALITSIILSFFASTSMLLISRLNYPGAEALNQLHNLADGEKPIIKIHMDTLTCMTGITRFLETPLFPSRNTSLTPIPTAWIYDKTESESDLLHPAFWDHFDYILVERPEKAIGNWELVGSASGYAGLRIIRPGDNYDYDIDVPFYGLWLFPDTCLGFRWRGFNPRRLERGFEKLYKVGVGAARKVTGGWWVGIRMEEKVRILKRGGRERE